MGINILLFTLILSIPVLGQAVVESKMYGWKKPIGKEADNFFASTIFEGQVHDMEYMHMSANSILPSDKKSNLNVPENEEHLIIIKSGEVAVQIKDSIWALTGGSMALLMPGEKYSLQNQLKDSCNYYLMKYRSKNPVDVGRGNSSGGSLIKEWKKLAFKTHGKGGIRNYFERPTAMSKRFEMHVTTLNEGIKSHEPHTHKAEEIVLIINNQTEMQIGEKFYKGGTGDIYYLGSNVPHAIQNIGKGSCTYFAFQFE